MYCRCAIAPTKWLIISRATLLLRVPVPGIGRGSKPSINVEIRKTLSLYANVVHSFNMPGIASRHENVDIVIIRENMEGEFSGMEHEVGAVLSSYL